MVLLAMVTALLALAMFGAHRTLRVLEQRRCPENARLASAAEDCRPAAVPTGNPATLR
jgi:hypothetical protein